MSAGSLAGRIFVRAAAVVAIVLAVDPLVAQTVNISGLSDISFSSLRSGEEARRSQSICVFSDLPARGYIVAAMGSGAGGNFKLDGGGASSLSYSVQWSDQPSEDSGMPLSPGMPYGGQASGATDETCSSGPPRSASLIVTISAAEIPAGRSGVNYSGTLSLTISPQ